MPRLQKRNLSQPDEIRPVGRGSLAVVELGDFAIGRIAYQPGWRWSTDVRPIVGTDLCQIHHVGVVLSGRLMVQMVDGTMLELGPDDAFEVPPGHDAWVLGGEPWVSIDSVGRRTFGKRADLNADRMLATILFTDLVDSTKLVLQLGDAAWRDRLSDYNQVARIELDRHRGKEIATTGDGVMAVFNSPTRGVQAAIALDHSAIELGLIQRAGLHTGEVEQIGNDIRGLAVHVAARVAAVALGHEVLVSATTAGLLVGSGLALDARGSHQLKGIDNPVDLFSVVNVLSGP